MHKLTFYSMLRNQIMVLMVLPILSDVPYCHTMSPTMFHIIPVIPSFLLSLSPLVNCFPLSTHTHHSTLVLLLPTIYNALQHCYPHMLANSSPSKIQIFGIWTLEVLLNCLLIYNKLLYHYYMELKVKKNLSKKDDNGDKNKSRGRVCQRSSSPRSISTFSPGLNAGRPL